MKTKLLAIAAVLWVSAISAMTTPSHSATTEQSLEAATTKATKPIDRDKTSKLEEFRWIEAAELEALQKLNELRQQLQAEPSDERKRELTSLLHGAVAEYFDRDLDHRRAELARLQKRAEDTETLLSRRAAAKDELVELQLQAIINDAEGLGLFGEHGRTVGVPLSVRQARREYVLPGGQRVQTPQNVPITYNDRVFDPDSLPSVEPPLKEEDTLRPLSIRLLRAYQVLRGAESAQEKSAARSELRTALSEYFEADMQQRQQSFAEVKQGLEEMESKLSKRADAKEEIVNLQVKLISNGAEGLGFFASPDRSGTATRLPGPGIPTVPAKPARATTTSVPTKTVPLER